MADEHPPAWWPVKVGDQLRSIEGDLLHVVATFEHDGRDMITTAVWLPRRRRWNYETFNATQAGSLKVA